MVSRRRYSVAILTRTNAAINDKVFVLNARNPEANQALPGPEPSFLGSTNLPDSGHSDGSFALSIAA